MDSIVNVDGLPAIGEYRIALCLADPLPEIAQRIGPPLCLGVDVLKRGQQRMLFILTAQANCVNVPAKKPFPLRSIF